MFFVKKSYGVPDEKAKKPLFGHFLAKKLENGKKKISRLKFQSLSDEAGIVSLGVGETAALNSVCLKGTGKSEAISELGVSEVIRSRLRWAMTTCVARSSHRIARPVIALHCCRLYRKFINLIWSNWSNR